MSFAVSSVVREEVEVLARFINHYSALGAREIHLHVDDAPSEPIARLGGDQAGCEVRVRFFDASFWRERLGDNYMTLRLKHRIAHRIAQDSTAAEWVFCTDSDEFILPGVDIGEMLEAVPDDVPSLKLPTVEAVWGPGEDIDAPFGSTWFRRPVWAKKTWMRRRRLIYGAACDMLDHGLAGHHNGKYFIRSNIVFDELRSHNAIISGENVTVGSPRVLPPQLRTHVAHFDAVCFSRWRQKFARRVQGGVDAGKRDARQTQMRRFAEAIAGPAAGDEGARRLFRSLYKLSVWQIALLSASGWTFRRRLFPDLD